MPASNLNKKFTRVSDIKIFSGSEEQRKMTKDLVQITASKEEVTEVWEMVVIHPPPHKRTDFNLHTHTHTHMKRRKEKTA